MTPRNTKQGASANARRAPATGAARTAPSPRIRSTRAQSATPSPRATRSAAPARAQAVTASGTSPRAKQPARAKQSSGRPAKARTKADHSVAWRWWLLPLAVIAVSAIFVATYYPVAKVQYRETREKMQLQAQLSAIQARNARLEASVAKLKTPEGVEDYARSQLGLVKAGEHVVVIVDGNAPVQPATFTPPAITPAKLDSEEAAVPPAGPWTKFLDSIFGVQ